MNFERLSPLTIKRLQIAAACLSLIPLGALIVYFGMHTVNLPWGEGYFYSDHIAIPAYDHTLTPNMLFIQYLDHRNVVSNLLIAANTFLTRWDVRVQSIITIVEMVSVAVFAALAFRVDAPRLAIFAAIPFSMLFLEINFQSTWLRQYNDTVFPFVFISVALWAIRAWRPGWRTLLFAALMAVLSSYSTLIGTASWAVLPLALWLVGYRQPKYAIAWAVMAALCGAAFLVGYKVSGYSTLGGPVIDKVLFGLVLLGAAFSRNVVVACIVGVLGGVMAVLNLNALRRRENFRLAVSVWVSMLAYALIATFMTAAGRGGYGPDYAINAPHFFRLSSYWWAASIGLMLLALAGAGQLPAWLKWTNLAVLTLLIPLYIQVNIQAANTWIMFDGQQPIGPTPSDEQCAWHFVMTDDTSCMSWPYFFNKPRSKSLLPLAERRLTTFAHDNPAFSARLPEGYQPGDPVIVDAPLAVQHVAILEPGGAPVSPSSLVQVVKPGQDGLLTEQTGSFSGGEAEMAAVRRRLRESSRIWVMRLANKTQAGDALVRSFLSDHLALAMPHDDAFPYPDFNLYVPRPPSSFAPAPIGAGVGGRIRLIDGGVTDTAWNPLNGPEPGQMILVSLDWEISQKVDANYSVFIHLEDGSGKLVAQFDGQYETSAWNPADPHQVIAPLAIPAGAAGPFKVYVGFYNVADGKRLDVMWPGHDVADNRILLAELR